MDTAGLALAVLQLSAHAVSAIYTYTQDVKAARTDIDRLNTELFALMGIFQRLTATAFPSVDRTSYASSLSSSAAASSTYAESTLTLVGDELMGEEKGEKGEYATGDGLPGNSLPHLSSLPGFSEMLQATSDLLKDLLDQLQIPKSKSMAQRKQLLKWPFKKDEVKQILERLERMKSYFLLSVMTNDTELTQGLVEEVRQLRREMQAAKEAAGKMDPEEERRKLATWLCPVDPEAMMKKVGERTTKGSGEWFVGGNKIKKWLEVGSGVFWLNGITGAGKTTLMTTVIEFLLTYASGSALNPPETSVAYFYCSFYDRDSLNTAFILGSLAFQLCEYKDEVYQKLLSHAGGNFSKTSSQIPHEELIKLMIEASAKRRRVVILIDGINECEDPPAVLEYLKTLVKNARCTLNLFISAINEKGIEQSLRDVPLITHKLQSTDIKSDVHRYIRERMESSSRLRIQSPQLKALIEWRLVHGVQGMFRWVQCQLDRLSRLRTPGAIEDALAQLPMTLEDTYRDILLRIDGEEDQALARDILEMVAIAVEPLTLRQIVELLQVTPGAREHDTRRLLSDPTDVLSICGGLLQYNQVPLKRANVAMKRSFSWFNSVLRFEDLSGTVTLAHHSVMTYLTSKNLPDSVRDFQIDKHTAHARMTHRCLTYLLFRRFETCAPNTAELKKRLDECPLLTYAAFFWPFHLSAIPDSSSPSSSPALPPAAATLYSGIWPLLRAFTAPVNVGSGNFRSWVQLLLPESTANETPTADTTPPLYYAASFGLTPLVRQLLQEGARWDVTGGRFGSTPLNIAVFRGYVDVVKVMLEAGVDPRLPDRHDSEDEYRSRWTPPVEVDAMRWAGWGGNAEIAEILKEWMEKNDSKTI